MRDDWRLAIAVNNVGRSVFEALQTADEMPDEFEHVYDGVPNTVSPEYIAGREGPPEDPA